jgi:predicted nucleotide-binding protein
MNDRITKPKRVYPRTILWVEDDHFFVEALSSELNTALRKTYTFRAVSTASLALDYLASHCRSVALVITDIMMHSGDLPSTVTRGGYHTGITLAREVRRLYPQLPILALTGLSGDKHVSEFFRSQPRMAILTKHCPIDDIARVATTLIGRLRTRRSQPRVFIVHGHDDNSLLALKNYLQNTLHLGEPTILRERPSCGRTIIEKFEQETKDVDIVFVMVTPDDRVISALTPNGDRRRGRQNVIFEMGYFYAKLQRTSGQVIALVRGEIELPSDILGIVYIDISKGIEAAGEEIRRELGRWL